MSFHRFETWTIEVLCTTIIIINRNQIILLNPTISEGGAVSVLNVLGNGVLLPVYSEATGIALSDVGVCVPNVAYKDFEEALLALEAMPDDVFEQKALRAHLLVKDNYTIEKYEEHMFAYLKEIIEKNR